MSSAASIDRSCSYTTKPVGETNPASQLNTDPVASRGDRSRNAGPRPKPKAHQGGRTKPPPSQLRANCAPQRPIAARIAAPGGSNRSRGHSDTEKQSKFPRPPRTIRRGKGTQPRWKDSGSLTSGPGRVAIGAGSCGNPRAGEPSPRLEPRPSGSGEGGAERNRLVEAVAVVSGGWGSIDRKGATGRAPRFPLGSFGWGGFVLASEFPRSGLSGGPLSASAAVIFL
ncbi:hypothetical protein SETIT_3G146100v2 [Setaria italica]|uniref:Uncharacterized protein n=1 Tax=Setaria italica TaxID=4555 RepID=A0A368QFM9_SETIT|nr:hypothetical protein SETIT_3G146100v2 [Setaria italica]